MTPTIQPPTSAYVGASWAALFIGVMAYLIGLWNAEMMLNEKGYYLAVLILGLYAAISLQKPFAIKTKASPHPIYITASVGWHWQRP